MTNAEMIKQINTAMGAHGMWKLRLRTAVESGRGDIGSADAGCDDKCAFGKWLYGSALGQPVREGMPYKVVKWLHADFHRSAGSGRAMPKCTSMRSRMALGATTGPRLIWRCR